MNFKDDERCRLLHKSALHFGYYDGKLELTAGNTLEAFTTHNAILVVLVDLRDKVFVGLNFVEKNQRSSIKTMMFSQDNFEMLKPMLFVVSQWEFFQMLRNLHSCQLISYTKLNQCNLCKF